MIQKNITLKKRKKERLKINDINDFKVALNNEGYKFQGIDEDKFKERIVETFKINKNVADRLDICIKDDINYRANDIKDFIDYIEKIIVFENEHEKLCEKISEIKRLYIDRIEYDRVPSVQDNVDDILKAIEEIKDKISSIISEEEKAKLEILEKEVDKDYVYSKDIELLKKMIICNNKNVKEEYDDETRTKTLFIELPKEINNNYIPAVIGSIEYHQHIKSNIPRIKRLIRNINKYMLIHEDEEGTFKINQSETVQDTINIAIATFDNKEFKAISGSNNIEGYCRAPQLKNEAFESCKVNKLGKLGIGYKRINDSEKKILEEIHKQIEEKELKDEGELVLYSKWEPCPSCYYVISQFCIKHPNIRVKVKYDKRYGE